MFYFHFEDLLAVSGIEHNSVALPLGLTASTAILWTYFYIVVIERC
jgi:hypothetical protein